MWNNTNPRATNPTPEHIRQATLRRDNHTCVICGQPGNQADHINPQGEHHLSNMQTLCLSCHKIKTNHEAANTRSNNRKKQHRNPKTTPLQKYQANQT